MAEEVPARRKYFRCGKAELQVGLPVNVQVCTASVAKGDGGGNESSPAWQQMDKWRCRCGSDVPQAQL
jgi:hypothetical protein